MHGRSIHHDYDLLEQASPKTLSPFGFVCSCGEVHPAAFTSARQALRAASDHCLRRSNLPERRVA
jgi:hypothetical protein